MINLDCIQKIGKKSLINLENQKTGFVKNVGKIVLKTKKNLRTEVFDKLDKSKETFIKKIKETKYFQNNLPEIENLLKKDIELEKYWYDQATRW